MTCLAALRHDRIDAPWVIDGPVNAEIFLRYVETQLAPTLGKGDVVIIDNLSSHKGPAVRTAIRATGARLLFLPAYSPDLNPIEQLFAKLKHLLRKACARTVEATWKQIGHLLGQFTAKECKNYLSNLGYGQPNDIMLIALRRRTRPSQPASTTSSCVTGANDGSLVTRSLSKVCGRHDVPLPAAALPLGHPPNPVSHDSIADKAAKAVVSRIARRKRNTIDAAVAGSATAPNAARDRQADNPDG